MMLLNALTACKTWFAGFTGRKPQPTAPNTTAGVRRWLAILAEALLWALLFALVIIFWPSDGSFVYEGF